MARAITALQSSAPLQMRPSRIAWIAAATFALALLVRVVYVLVQSRFALFDVTFVASDSILYLTLADNIASGRGMTLDGNPTAFVGPGYPLFVAVLRRFGADPFAIGVAQSVLGSLTAALAAGLAFELGRASRLADRRLLVVTGLAGLGAAVYPHVVFWTGYVLTETLFVFLVALSLYLTALAGRTGGPIITAAGLVMGLAAVTRPPALAIGLVLAIWLALAALRGIARGGWLFAILFLIGLTLPVGAWAARNAVVLGAPVVTSTESGQVFYQGNSKGATGGTRGYVDGNDFVVLDLPPALSEVERDAIHLRLALQHIAEDPAATIARWPKKIWNMWRPTYEGSSVRNGAITLLTYLPALGLGLTGAVLLARRGGIVTTLPALFIAAWFAIHVIVTGMIRFRVAAEILLVVAAPFAIAAFIDSLSRARSRA